MEVKLLVMKPLIANMIYMALDNAFVDGLYQQIGFIEYENHRNQWYTWYWDKRDGGMNFYTDSDLLTVR